MCFSVYLLNLVGLVTAQGGMCSLRALTVFLQLRRMYMYSVVCIFNLLSFYTNSR